MGEARRTRTTTGLVVTGFAAVALLLGACGDDDDNDSSSDTTESSDAGSGGGDATLDVTSFEFSDVTAPAGGTLAVVNSRAAPTRSPPTTASSTWSCPTARPSRSVPSEPGAYAFHCEIHPSMAATLTAE